TYNANPSNPGGTPSLNLDLSGYEKFEVTFSRVDRAVGFHSRVRSGTVFGSSYLTATTPGIVTAGLTSFSNYGSINWADVDMVRLEISTSYKSGGSAHTESISDFRVVPEPASIILFLTAGGLFLRRRRQM
ncbi:MAG: PEP-CTERM sorting domain-containing protein, partial [Planctomycetota bacterium]|nr:PEP-CTERM sorting domain-containing protein [Planctomycetota bacterium]